MGKPFVSCNCLRSAIYPSGASGIILLRNWITVHALSKRNVHLPCGFTKNNCSFSFSVTVIYSPASLSFHRFILSIPRCQIWSWLQVEGSQVNKFINTLVFQPSTPYFFLCFHISNEPVQPYEFCLVVIKKEPSQVITKKFRSLHRINACLQG